MSSFKHIQTNFRGGEISPEVHGRTDLELYPASLEEALNFIIRSEGGAGKRPGTEFLKKSLVLYRPYGGYPVPNTLNGGAPVTLTGKVVLKPFIFNRTEVYCVVIMRFGGETGFAIVKVDTLAEAVISNPALATNTYWPTSNFQSYSSDAQLDEIQIAQTGDLLFFTHPDHPPFHIARTGTGTFEIRAWWMSPLLVSGANTAVNAFGERGVPYQTLNLDTNLQLASVATVGGSNQTVTSTIPFFTADMVGAVLKINSGGVSYYRFITVFVNSTTVTTQDGLSGPHVAIVASSNFEVSEWYPGRGWPRTVTFYEQRLNMAGTLKKADTLWASETADIFEWDALGAVTDVGYPAVVATDPFSLTVASNEVNQMQWISGSRTLGMGTLGREYIARGVQSALSPLDVSISPETAHGSTFRQPTRMENALLFVAKAGNKIREFIFNRDEDSYVADDLTRFSDHMTSKTLGLTASQNRPGINHIVKQEADETVIWILDNNGGLFATTRDRSAGTNAFHYHFMGGVFGVKIPEVQSITVLPSTDGNNDDLWLTVKRTINAATVTYIERINKEFSLTSVFNSSASILDKMVYCDSAILYKPGGTFTVVTGLSHLEGQSVVVVGDGMYLGPFVVTGAQITLNKTCTEAIVGLNYNARLRTLNLEAGSRLGSSQGAIKKFDQLTIRFSRTIGAFFGWDPARLDEIQFRPVDLPMNDPIPLFTGDKTLTFPANFDREGKLYVEQNLPLPCSVNALIIRGVTND